MFVLVVVMTNQRRFPPPWCRVVARAQAVTDITASPRQFRQTVDRGSMLRRFPPPWSVQELEACFVLTDSTRQKIAYVHFEDDPERRSAAKLLQPR
jgi:hypothetical protein